MLTKKKLLELLADVPDDVEVIVRVRDDSTDSEFAELHAALETSCDVVKRLDGDERGRLLVSDPTGADEYVPHLFRPRPFDEVLPVGARGTRAVILYAITARWTTR